MLAPPTKLTDKQRWAAYQECFGTVAGQLVLEDLQTAHHMYASTVKSSPIDPLAVLLCEGERNTILRIMAILETKEDEL